MPHHRLHLPALTNHSYPILLAALITISASLLQADIGLNTSDGGFLWYGTLRVLEGEVPMVDFRAYDPGRYYWCAAWTWFLGDGLIDLRRAVSIMQFVGLSGGLLVASRVIRNRFILGLFGLLMAVWMFPQHKYFDSTLAISGVYVAVRLLENPSVRRLFITGLFVGLSAFIGRNHGLYLLLGFVLIIVYIHWKVVPLSMFKSFRALFSGIFIGYSPMIAMMIFIPNFFDEFWYSLLLLVSNKTTTIPVQTPWPWLADFTSSSWLLMGLQISLGIAFLLFFIFYTAAWGYVWFSKSSKPCNARTVLIASAFIGVFYMHHGFSRADVGHMAGAIHPILLGLIALVYIVIKKYEHMPMRHAVCQWIGLGVIGMVLFPPTLLGNAFFEKKLSLQGKYVPYQIKDEQLSIVWWSADYLTVIRETMQAYVGDKEAYVLIAPAEPALYPILGYKSPVWDIYMTLPNTPERQQAMIEQIENKKVKWALISTLPPAADERLLLERAEPILWSYLMERFEPVEIERLNSWDLLLLQRAAER